MMFFDWLHKFQLTGSVFANDAWRLKWFYLADALECNATSESGVRCITTLLRGNRGLAWESKLEWLSVSRHSFLAFDTLRRNYLCGLSMEALCQILRPANREHFVRSVPACDLIHLAVAVLSRRKTVAITNTSKQRIEYPWFTELSLQFGRESCRDRVCQYVYISVLAGYLKKKNTYIL